MIKRILAGRRTIRMRIIAIVALCWLLPTLVLGVYMGSVFFSALREKTEQALVSGAMRAQEMTVQEIERILKKSKDVTYDDQLSDFTARYKSGSLRYEEFLVSCRSYWYRMFRREQGMDFTAFFLVDAPQQIVHTTERAESLPMFRSSVQSYILTLGETLDTRSRFVYVRGWLYHVRNLYNRKMERFGMMALRLKPDELFAPLLDESTLWQGQTDIILDEYEYLPNTDYAWDLENDTFGLFEHDGDLYYSQEIKTTDYHLRYRIRVDESAVFGQINVYYQLIIFLILLLVPLEAMILLFLHKSMMQPLTRLSRATERLAMGELGITVPAQGEDEISRLGMAFNTMSLQMQHLIDKSYREELALRDARISALQSRINPHFLNNALELMNWQARMDGADAVGEMIEAMSTLINAALDRVDERTVPLRMEVEIADAYFFFIQQRFGGRVSIVKNIDPALQNIPVPRLIIQTLLENAVEHGISPAGGGTIRLDVYRRDERLYIDVCNDGKPLTEEGQARINRLLGDTSRDAHSEHLGIRNVNLRLKLIYHDEAGLSLGTDENGGTLARIHIPLYDEEESE